MTGDCWLWQEKDGVRWLTPSDTGFLPIILPSNVVISNSSDLRDLQQKPMYSVLQPELCQILSQQLQKYPNGLRLHLGADLPKEWQTFPFQWLHLEDGKNLQGRLIVERYTPRIADFPNSKFPSSSKVAIVNLLPKSEATYFKGVKQVKGKGPVKHFWHSKNLLSFSMLCVIVHGSEQANALPFRLEKGELWELPTEQGFPPLVLLIVCGDEQGNLVDYGKTLLDLGVQTVIAPIGQLDAPPSAEFLKTFLEKWQAGQRVDEILLEAQAQPNSKTAAQRLQLLGRGELRINDAENQEELSFLVNSITLRCFQEQGNLYKAVELLLNLPKTETKQKELLQQFDKIQVWELSRYWLIPLLVYLAEKYDHNLLRKYELARLDLNQHLKAVSPAVYHYWAKLYYRHGRYELAIKETVDGICPLTDETLYSLGEGLLGNLINLLIDLNLPKEGLLLCDRLDEYLAVQQTQKAREDRHNLLDRAARLALKQKLYYKAITKYKNKQLDSIQVLKENGERELAWLLYITAFLRHKEAPDYAKQVKKILIKKQNQENFGKGNENEFYLMRALSLSAWRGNDSKAVDLLKDYVEVLHNRIHSLQDSGPLGLTLIYLHLYCQENPKSRIKFDLPPLEEIYEILENDRYWFELAILGSLLNAPESERWLRKFQKQRQGALSDLERLPTWLQDGNWGESVKQQNQKELQVLLGDTAPSVEKLIEAGLLPL